MRNFRTFLLPLNFAVIWLVALLAHGQIPGIAFTALGAFDDTNSGANPYAPPVLGADGNLYGTLPYGGTNGAGAIFQVTTNGSQTTLYGFQTNFNSWSGTKPFAPLVSGQDGNLYGVASSGGTNSMGTIFEITTNGAFTLLYSFGMVTNALGYALDGSTPYGGLVQGRDGNFYGMTYSGGISNVGTVFQFATNGVLTTKYSFTGNGVNGKGAYPVSQPLVEGADGVFYGTTSAGGTNNDGTVFKITANGALTNLFEFNYTDGGNPYAGLSFGSDGNLYGTTVYGGTNGYGTAFQITTNGVLTTLFQFGGPEALYYPEGGVVPGNGNTLFGTTYYDNEYGSVFQLTTNGVLTKLHSFANGFDGANPYAGVIRDSSGNLFGTALYGGTNGGYGTVYSLSFTALLSILSPTANEFQTNSVLTVTGTASDNAPGGAVTNVFYSLNGGAWTNATTPNGWINWTGSVMSASASVSAVLTVSTNGVGSLSTNYNGASLQVPDANTIAAYAVDNGGNSSPTNNVSFLYVRKYYSITATAGTGFEFTNWTGGTNLPLAVLTNGATIQFLMEPNLMLQANFVDLITPTLSITNVPAGLSVGNAAFTVQGKAGDNWQVTNVFYSLNSGGWSNAVTGNNWTNWSADLMLAPGTNTIAAYAVDAGGNASLTNSASMLLVATNQLQISAIGRGTISPNYSNAWLQIGRNYAITATAASGFAFTNWTISTNWLGGVITNKPTVQFMMASNLTLQVTFADVTKPALSITNVTAGMNVSNSYFTVKGMAGDNVAVTGVFCAVSNSAGVGPWIPASTGNAWTNWNVGANLASGANTLLAYAVDGSGNLSTTNTANINYVVSATLTVRTNGLGTLNPNYNGALLQIGISYSITATAGSGFAFTNWTGGTNLPLTYVTNKTTVRFLMVTNLMLQANFLDTTKPTLTITAPTAGQHMTNALANIAGTTSDNWNVAGVWYQLTNALLTNLTWNLAATTNSYTNWTTTVTLAAGTNSVKAYAVDLGGNLSTTSSVSFMSSNSFDLQLVLTNPPAPGGSLNFQLLLSPVLNGHIQFSTNLVDWSTLTNFVGTNATVNIRDAAAGNYSNRFYRAVVP